MGFMDDFIKKNRITEVECLVPDMSGIARGKIVPAEKFLRILRDRGLRLPEAIFVQTVTGEFPDDEDVTSDENSDIYMIPDERTIRFVPWYKEPTAQVITDCVYADGSPVDISPRHVLKRVLALYDERGWKPMVAPELEFFLVQVNKDPDYPLVPPVGRNGRVESGRQAFGIDAVNGLPHSFLRYLAHKTGMNPETDFTITALQPQAMVAAMKRGTIDAMVFSPPFTLAAEAEGGANWISGPDVDLPELRSFPYNVVLVRPDYCRTEAALCRGFVAALRKAIALMRSEPEAGLAALAKTFEAMEPAILRRSYALFAHHARADVSLTEEMYRNVVAFDRIAGLIPQDAVVPPIGELYSPGIAP